MRMWYQALLLVVCLQFSCSVFAHDISGIVKQVKPSVVGIGIFDPMGSPRANLMGTGFAVGDGSLIVTNYHVVEKDLDPESMQKRVVFVGTGNNPETLEAKVLEIDPLHDLAVLSIEKKLNPLKLAPNTVLDDGVAVGFTGFPIGAVLGLYPATHTGIIAAYTPVVTPSVNSDQLSIEMMKRLREPYFIYQMDATAYPGNSGSPVYELESGQVVGVINKVFIQQTKESALTNPSGISYSIPVQYVSALLDQVKGSQ